MRGGPRLRRLERALSPRQAVLAWLVTAQRHPSLDAYARSLLDVPGPRPLEALLGRAESNARRRQAGALPMEARRTVDRAAGDAVFLYQLVLELNRDAETRLSSLLLGTMVTRSSLDIAAERWERERSLMPGPDLPSREVWSLWARQAEELALEVRMDDEARQRFEHSYFAGHPVLFEDLAERWGAMGERVDDLVTEARRPPWRRSRRRPPRHTPVPNDMEVRITERCRTLADAARLEAFTRLGRTAEARRLVDRRLRAK